MNEVEVLVKVNENKLKAINKLKQHNYIGKKIITDTYFYDPLRKQMQPNNQNKLRECFRLREAKGKNSITYKKDYYDKHDLWTHSNEFETQINNPHTLKQIIKKLGFVVLVTIKSTKHFYKTKNYEIALEEVKDLGLFLEIEKKTPTLTRNVLKEKTNINKFIKSLKINTSEELNSGKPELMLKINKKVD